MTTNDLSAREAIEAITGREAWAIIRRSTRAGDRDTVGVLGGRRWVAESIMDIPLETGIPAEGRLADRLVAVPFRQVRERGFEAHDDGTPLVVVDVDTELEFSVEEVVEAIDDVPLEFADRGGFETSDADYEKVVEAIIRDEIGQGQGANLVIGRTYRATLAQWGRDHALAVFRRLLERERGAYWTYVFFTGDRYLVGASPERHVSVHGGDVRMNPISGTFRLPGLGTEHPAGRVASASEHPAGRVASASERIETTTGQSAGRVASASERIETTTEHPAGRVASASERIETTTEHPGGRIETTTEHPAGRVASASERIETKPALLDFLRDEKEIFELFMVVDEELKMMCDICDQGGQVLGPFLKPMSRLIHTEYLLAGRTARDPREVLRDTMYAATVTGSPVENACRLIRAYESEGRGYYGAALAIFGRDSSGAPTVDSPIVIRSADVSPSGELKVTAGATLVRDSDPAGEVAETHAKAGGILSAFGLVPAATSSAQGIAELVVDDDVLVELGARNRRLSRFWLVNQGADEDAEPDPGLAGRHVVILDGEDDFVRMLRHVLRVCGMTSSVLRHEEYAAGAFDDADLVIVGPGPGDPRDDADPKMAQLRRAVTDLLAARRPFLAVCLGHQALCHTLGLPLAYKDIVFQGTQSPLRLTLDGRTRVERVGFYNTFVARVPGGGVSGGRAVSASERGVSGGRAVSASERVETLPPGVTVDADPETGDVHLLRGPHYVGIQFHAESILTEHGFDVLHSLVSELLLR